MEHANTSEFFRHRLHVCGIAIAWLMLSFFSFVPRLEAEIVYTPVNVTLSGTGTISINLNHDQTTDFAIVSYGKVIPCAGTGWGSFGYVDAVPTSGNGVVAAWAGSSWAAALGSGITIDSRWNFYKGQALMEQYSSCVWPPHVNYGEWIGLTGINRYLGLEFQISGATHYGWARRTVSAGRYGPVTALTGFAYETTGKGITTGQTSGY